MSIIKDEQAFPASGFIHDPNGQLAGPVLVSPGMTLRDWFAGQSLAMFGQVWMDAPRGRESEVISKEAYRIADAMLEERKSQSELFPVTAS